jgi:hypothetical protein
MVAFEGISCFLSFILVDQFGVSFHADKNSIQGAHRIVDAPIGHTT